jgi:hypothetical protein
MVLNRLVWSCFTRRTQHSEKGLCITIAPHEDEKVLFFLTDCPDGRRSLGLSGSDRMCDVVIFYRGRDAAPVLLLSELKSCDFGHAVDQIRTT